MSSVFVVNAGSSSLKYQLVDVASGAALASGLVERIGEARSPARHVAGDVRSEREVEAGDHEAAFAHVLAAFAEHGPALDDAQVVAVGHRVVQGGDRFDAAVVIDDDVVAAITDVAPLAPLHNPANLLGITAARAAFPTLPHVAVFDTAFHRTLPRAAWRYAIDRAVADEHQVRKYGFHGTSHQFVARRTAELLGRPLEQTRTVVLHLGNGASACAVDGGRSVETSMGLTPLAGLVMGTRSGDVDPGVLIHLHRVAGMSIDDLDRLLNQRSGLLGLTGTGDLRDVVRAAGAGDDHAVEALEVLAHRLRSTIGAYLAVLGGADAIAFTAGVGENSAPVRAAALAGLEGLGIELDAARNESGPAERRISTDASRVAVWVVPTAEELEIARQSAAVVEAARPPAILDP
ncbi:acetate kinase [Nocardioides dongxiaopingii]|uniref:acetate/propionate family kinase n=1 Tax=Nocardioides sp. S-1144 TaxID=2582905 RepID=UPI00110DE6EE|nr:acetate kinase [Nocardioides sp. S-1144]QCW50445.1 acetate kinase [Nocardioides sp. S-1144]